jgi:hypothetical protein
LGVATVVLAFLLAAGASALPYTLDASVLITGQDGVWGSIDPVFDLTGTTGLSDVGGNLIPNEGGVPLPPFTGYDVFVVDVTLRHVDDGGSAAVDAIGISVLSTLFFLNPVGAGEFNDAGQAPSSVFADDQAQLAGIFDFSGDTLDPGETTNRLFVLYLPEGDMAIGQGVNFMVSSGAGDFTVSGVLIPEPGTLVLLGTGLAALGVGARKRQRAG